MAITGNLRRENFNIVFHFPCIPPIPWKPSLFPSGQNHRKSSLQEWCRINKKALLQTVFLAILSAGLMQEKEI